MLPLHQLFTSPLMSVFVFAILSNKLPLVDISCIFRGRGISSSGRAPASHAGGTGIDTRIFQLLLFILIFYLALFLKTTLKQQTNKSKNRISQCVCRGTVSWFFGKPSDDAKERIDFKGANSFFL